MQRRGLASIVDDFAERVGWQRQLAHAAHNLRTKERAWDEAARGGGSGGCFAITSMRAAMPCACGAMSSRFLSLNVMTHCSASGC